MQQTQMRRLVGGIRGPRLAAACTAGGALGDASAITDYLLSYWIVMTSRYLFEIRYSSISRVNYRTLSAFKDFAISFCRSKACGYYPFSTIVVLHHGTIYLSRARTMVNICCLLLLLRLLYYDRMPYYHCMLVSVPLNQNNSCIHNEPCLTTHAHIQLTCILS